jgi:hypothetical protein
MMETAPNSRLITHLEFPARRRFIVEQFESNIHIEESHIPDSPILSKPKRQEETRCRTKREHIWFVHDLSEPILARQSAERDRLKC